jgi:sodium/bile acid cotransporter 7
MPFLKRHFFTLLLFFTPILAWRWPELGASGGIFKGSCLKTFAIILIFFFSGLQLSTKSVVATTKKIKLHCYIQLFCFLLFPLTITFLQWPLALLNLNPNFIMGILIVACLPTTISSCVVITRLAGGDHISSLFNAVLSNFLGVFISPIILGLLSSFDSCNIDIIPLNIIKKLMLLALLPMLCGAFAKTFLPKNIPGRKISALCIVTISYVVFCDTFLSSGIRESAISDLIELAVVMGALYLFFMMLASMGSKVLNFSSEEKKAILFTAPQKTLALGLPIIIALNESNACPVLNGNGVLYTLPLLLYHHIQLLISSIALYFVRNKTDIRDT